MIEYINSVVSKKKDSLHKNANNKIHVLLVYGGLSSEREVSFMSYKDIESSLLDLGYSVTLVDMGHDFLEVVKAIKPDVVFNGLYGTYGEDGHVPALLNLIGIKYTHSGVLSSALGFNKKMSFNMLKANHINCAEMKIINRAQAKEIGNKDPMPRPYVIKPISEGSSIGIEVIFPEDKYKFSNYEWKYGDEIIVEPYIPGRELSVAVLEGKAMGTVEMIPIKKRFYDYESKYTPNMTKHLIPAPLSKEEESEVLKVAEQVHNIFGCKTISRVDFRYNPEEKNKPHKGFYVLEINTHPGMTPLSIVPEICLAKGISYTQIVDKLVKDGLS
jgi:D-alanine-D-alanine ligase